MEENKIHQIDVLEGLKQLEDESVDFIITDPPYGTKYEKWDVFDDYVGWLDSWIKESHRVLKSNGSICVFNGMKYIAELNIIMKKYFKFRDWIIWVNKLASGFNPKGYGRDWEGCLWFSKSDDYKFYLDRIREPYAESTANRFKYKTIKFDNSPREVNVANGKIPSNVIEVGRIVGNQLKEFSKHPTIKPLKLIYRFIEAHTDEGDLVLDMFMGSGTTAVACDHLARRWVGFEIDSDYIKICNKRLKQKNIVGFLETLTPSNKGDIITVSRESADSPNSNPSDLNSRLIASQSTSPSGRET